MSLAGRGTCQEESTRLFWNHPEHKNRITWNPWICFLCFCIGMLEPIRTHDSVPQDLVWFSFCNLAIEEHLVLDRVFRDELLVTPLEQVAASFYECIDRRIEFIPWINLERPHAL